MARRTHRSYHINRHRRQVDLRVHARWTRDANRTKVADTRMSPSRSIRCQPFSRMDPVSPLCANPPVAPHVVDNRPRQHRQPAVGDGVRPPQSPTNHRRLHEDYEGTVAGGDGGVGLLMTYRGDPAELDRVDLPNDPNDARGRVPDVQLQGSRRARVTLRFHLLLPTGSVPTRHGQATPESG